MVAALQPAACVVVDESLTSGGDYWGLSAGAPPFSHLALTGGAIGQGPPCAVGCAVACPGRRVLSLQADGSGLYSAQALWTQARTHTYPYPHPYPLYPHPPTHVPCPRPYRQASENLDVVTIVCANRKYNILRLEIAMQGVGAPNATHTDTCAHCGAVVISMLLRLRMTAFFSRSRCHDPRAGASGPTTRRLTDLGGPPVDWVALAQGLGVPATTAATVGELEGQLRAALGRKGPSLIEAVLP